MVDRVRCATCGAESFAGPNLHCSTCIGRLQVAHDRLLAENANLYVELNEKREALRQFHGLETEEIAQTLVRLQKHVNTMGQPLECGHPTHCLVWPDGESSPYCAWCADLENGKAELARLVEELKVADELLETRMALVEAVPECPEHGPQCVPHAIEWVKTAQDKLSYLEGAVKAAQDDAIMAMEVMV